MSKGNTYESSRARCAFYARQDAQCIYCRAESGHVSRQGFANNEMKKAHLKKYCYKDWEKCFWAKAIEEMLGE